MKYALFLAFILLSCKTEKSISPEIEEDKTYILIDGEQVEIVADDFGNQYLKQYMKDGTYIFTPFPFETEDEETKMDVKILQVKTNKNDRRRF